MKAEKYFEKNGVIFGVSEKFEFGKWTGYSVEFTSMEEALKWLSTDENSFSQRSLVSKTRAKEYPRVDVNKLLDPWCLF